MSKTKFFKLSALGLVTGFFLLTLPLPSIAQDSGISDIPIETMQGKFDVDSEFDVDDDWDAYDTQLIKDPYEKYNRWMFNINDKIYRRVFTPLAKGYDFLIPKKIQSSFNNLVRFSGTPQRFCNNILQLKFKASASEFARLVINGSIGIGGLFDPADRVFHLKQRTEDFGQTLGHYGVGSGPYVIWPVIGPSTMRDAVGVGADKAFSAFTWFDVYDVESQDAFRAFGYAKRVNNYAFNVRGNYERITKSAIDPYIALQHAYIQNRENNIKE